MFSLMQSTPETERLNGFVIKKKQTGRPGFTTHSNKWKLLPDTSISFSLCCSPADTYSKAFVLN